MFSETACHHYDNYVSCELSKKLGRFWSSGVEVDLLLPTAREGNVFRSVCHFVRGGGRQRPSPWTEMPLDRDPRTETPPHPQVLTSSGGHCSGRTLLLVQLLTYSTVQSFERKKSNDQIKTLTLQGTYFGKLSNFPCFKNNK